MSFTSVMSIFNRTIDIQGQTFSVCERPIDTAGESHCTNRHIVIDSEIHDETKGETFYHEVVHMMLELGGFDKLLDTNMEEALAQYLGVAFLNFISNNDNLPVLMEEKINE